MPLLLHLWFSFSQTGRNQHLSSRGSSCSSKNWFLWSTSGTRSCETSTPRREGECVQGRSPGAQQEEEAQACCLVSQGAAVLLQGAGGGRASGARSGDEETEIRQTGQMCPAVKDTAETPKPSFLSVIPHKLRVWISAFFSFLENVHPEDLIF